ncbi:MAG: hypothetical protein HY876_11090, partial [Coriobacteriales bacterium]|nr:hypothetical protein [Coriobacteriales bacterium]
LRGVDVSGDAGDQYITVKYGDRYADPPERPEDDTDLRFLHGFTDVPFGPFSDRSSSRVDLTEKGTVHKTVGAFSGIGWAADLRGSDSHYLAGSATKLDPGTRDMTFVSLVRQPLPTSGVLLDASSATNGFDVALAEGAWRFEAPSTQPGEQAYVAIESSPSDPVDDAFHMVGFTRSGSVATAFFDGRESASSSTFDGVSLTSGEAELTFGKSALDADLGLTAIWVGSAWSPAQMHLFYDAITQPQDRGDPVDPGR